VSVDGGDMFPQKDILKGNLRQEYSKVFSVEKATKFGEKH
jgi:hypothetical protein